MCGGSNAAASRANIHARASHIHANPNNHLVSANKHTHPLSYTGSDANTGSAPAYG